MQILSLIAHPRSESFCHAISKRAIQCLRGIGHHVEHIDLYEENFDPCLKAEEAYTIGDSFEDALSRGEDAKVMEYRSRVAKVEGLVVVHPNWWGKPPAILAGWIDRVLVPGVAYRLQSADGRPHALLNIKDAVIFNTSDTEEQREREELGDPLEAIWTRCILPYCGAENVQRHVFRPVVGSTAEARDRWLDNTEEICTLAFPAS